MGKFSQSHITPTGLQSARREVFLSHLWEETMPYCRWILKWHATGTSLQKPYPDQTTTPRSFLTANTVIQFPLHYSMYCFPVTRIKSRRKKLLLHRFSTVSHQHKPETTGNRQIMCTNLLVNKELVKQHRPIVRASSVTENLKV